MVGGCVASFVLPRFLFHALSAQKKARETLYCGSRNARRKFAAVLHVLTTPRMAECRVQRRPKARNQIRWRYEMRGHARERAFSDAECVGSLFIRTKPAGAGSTAIRPAAKTAGATTKSKAAGGFPGQPGHVAGCCLGQFRPRRPGPDTKTISGFRRRQAAADYSF